MISWPAVMKRFLAEEDAQDLIEYALLAVFIGLIGVLSWRAIATGIGADYIGWDGAVQSLSAPPNPGGGGS